MGLELQACPHCGATLPDVRDAFCSECGEALDGPPNGDAAQEVKQSGQSGAPPSPPGLAYSSLGRFALVLGVLFALIGCAVVAVWGLISIAWGDWFTGLLVCPLGFFLELALAVTFLRVMDLRPPA